MTEHFPCVACGHCCRNLHETMYANLRLPDGTCRHYDAVGRRCSIYENRPLLCRIDEYYAHYLKDEMDRNRYYELNVQACKNMMLFYEDYESYANILAKINQQD